MAHWFRLIFLGCLAFGEMGARKITPACQQLSIKVLLSRALQLRGYLDNWEQFEETVRKPSFVFSAVSCGTEVCVVCHCWWWEYTTPNYTGPQQSALLCAQQRPRLWQA